MGTIKPVPAFATRAAMTILPALLPLPFCQIKAGNSANEFAPYPVDYSLSPVPTC